MIGHQFGHYRIVEKIGAGGMGVVFRAHDERLDRDVAVKILTAGAFSDENSRKRFRKEALTLSKLNHSYIAAVFDFDSQDQMDYMVMELVPGQSLTARLRLEPLTEKEIASLGAQIAEALEEAHEHKVVHRDLKPGNVMVTPKGRVKVLDFGLAKLLKPVNAETTGTLTEAVDQPGTLPYMAPEQLQGETADARSDIFSFGAVLYEMATGMRPFRGEGLSRLMDQILRQPPVPPRAVNPRISVELERIVLKCLEKDPEQRYQSAKEIGVDLRHLSGQTSTAALPPVRTLKMRTRVIGIGTAVALVLAVGIVLAKNWDGLRTRLFASAVPSGIHSLAVLPLKNLSQEPNQAYFAEGMTEELITDLGQIRALKVTSHTSVMQYQRTQKTVPVIAKELGVEGVVTGAILQDGGRVRITVQLVNARTDQQIWAQSYQRDLKEVLSLQDEVARNIADEIRVEVTPQENAQLTKERSSVNPEAYEDYLRGRHFLELATTEEDIRTAMNYFKQTLARDPSSALGHDGLSDAFAALADTYLPPREVMPQAETEAAEALKLDDTLAEAHASLGWVRFIYDWDWPTAEREFKRAIELNPSNALAHDDYAQLLVSFSRDQEAFAESARATELDPLSLLVNGNRGLYYFLARQYDTAIEMEKRILDFEPNCAPCRAYLALAYAQKGESQQALEAARKTNQTTDSLMQRATVGGVFAVSGDRPQAEKVATELEEISKKRFVCPYEIGTTLLGLGRTDEAFQWFEKGYEAKSVCMVLLKVDPRLDSIRSDPRYLTLLKQVGFTP